MPVSRREVEFHNQRTFRADYKVRNIKRRFKGKAVLDTNTREGIRQLSIITQISTHNPISQFNDLTLTLTMHDGNNYQYAIQS